MNQFWKRRIYYLIIGCSIFAFGLVGCEEAKPDASSSQQSGHQEVDHGDIQETTKGINELPSFVKNLDPQIAEVYQVAAKNEQLLQWIPCYCGCGESAGHRSNRECFIQDLKKDGQITWDSHGTKCGTCLKIAAESVSLKEQGKSTLEIRKLIDEKYKEEYAKPTPTPMPAS